VKIFGFWATVWAFIKSIGDARRAHEMYSALALMSDDDLRRIGYTREELVRAVMDKIGPKRS
jgi:membrane-bound lytic murein transglycosylase B